MQQLFYLILTVFREPASQSPPREVDPPPAHPHITPLSGWKNLIFRFLTLVTILYIPPTSIKNPISSKFHISCHCTSNSAHIPPNLSYHLCMPSISCVNCRSKERSFEIHIQLLSWRVRKLVVHFWPTVGSSVSRSSCAVRRMKSAILKIIVWKGRRVYEAKRTAHWCVEACDYSYLTVLTGGGPHLKEQVVISCLMSAVRRREATQEEMPLS